MNWGLFFINSFKDAQSAFSAFKERGLIGKTFISKLSKTDPVSQLSDWLVLVRLFDTLQHSGPGGITVKANRKLAHVMVFDYEEFLITDDGSGGYEISTSAEINRIADGILGVVQVPAAWALYEDANDAFWQMVEEYRSQVSEKEFEKNITSIYHENCADYLDHSFLCRGSWMAIYDNKADWPFCELSPDEDEPYHTFQFHEDNTVTLSGWVLSALQISKAYLNRRTNEILYHDMVIGRATKIDGDELTVEMYYYRDPDCPEEYLQPGKETPIQYIKKDDDKRYSEYLCKRING